jgi:hypothetical protein
MLPALCDLVVDGGAPGFVGRALRESMGLDVEAGQGTISFVEYRPTFSCTVLWSFPTPGGTALVSTRLLRGQRGARIPSRASVRRAAEQAVAVLGHSASPCHYLAERQLLLEAFPMDIKLRGLARAASRDWIDATLAPALELSTPEAGLLKAELVSYRPWQRCVYRYDLEGRDASLRYFGKLFHDDQGEAMLPGLRRLSAGLRAAGSPWEVPAPVAYLRAERMLVTPAIGGPRKLNRLLRPARKEREARAALLGHMERAAQGLRSLQQTPTAGLHAVAPRDLVESFRRTTAKISEVVPQLGARVERCLQALERSADRLPAEPMVPTHGAFRLDQLVPCEHRLGVLDLDTLCRSGASADAGNFVAYLEALALRRPRLDGVLAECRKVFLQALATDTPAGSAWLSWYGSASLVKVAFRSFLNLAPGWPETSRALLHRAEARLAGIGS